MLVFEERGNQSTQRKPLGAEQRTNKLSPHDARSGRQVLSPLCHPCIPLRDMFLNNLFIITALLLSSSLEFLTTVTKQLCILSKELVKFRT